MQVALMIVGAILGVLAGELVGGSAAQWVGALLGGFVGYAVAEFRTLRVRGEELQREVEALQERVAKLQRREAGQGTAARETESGWARAARTDTGGASDGVLEPRAQGGPAGASMHGPAGSTPLDMGAAAPTSDAASASTRAPAPASVASAAYAAPIGVPAEGPLLRTLREYFTGGNTLVRVGILILFFGVAFLLRYVAEHSHVPIQVRLSGVAFGGVVLLALGWRLRPRRSGYALALQGGGFGILYLTTFAALRLYSLLHPTAAFAVLVCLAASCAVLAVLQNSQAFAFLAVTGGFLAPILASSGEGSHVVLFSYYAVLNASILAIAWYKAWRPLNLAGFAFTFLISSAWGVLHYKGELFASTEPFLVLFFAFYLIIAILFSTRQPPDLRGYVDGTLVFGTPMAAFGYQSGMLHERPLALASSAVLAGAVYFALAWFLQRQQRSSQRILVEAFVALGVVFFTVATPLALNGTATGVTWALEGAALVWVGARQDRVVPRVFGVLLQLFAGAIQLSNADLFAVATAPAFGVYMARAVSAVAAVLCAVLLKKYVQRLRPYEMPGSSITFFLGLAEWLFCGLIEIDRYAPHGYALAMSLIFVTLSALACSELSRRTALSLARLPAVWLLPALGIFAAAWLMSPGRHPFDYAGWLAWPLAFTGFYVICRRHEGAAGRPLANGLHIPCAWLLVALLTWQAVWFIDRGVMGRGSWVAVGWALVPSGVLALLPRLVQCCAWPMRAHREAYYVFVGGGLAAYLVLWSLVTNVSLPGDPDPFAYLPLLNALDLAQALVLLVLARYCLGLRMTQPAAVTIADVAPVVVLAMLTFVWLNAVLVRTLHRWAAVPLDFDAVVGSTLVQTSLSIFWTVLALLTMLAATRRGSRPVWITGAALLAVTIVKLFVIDLARVGTVERIVSFVGVGLLTLVIGYFSPLPPAATLRRTTGS